MGKIIGIDLGTTNSVVAIMDGKEPKVLTNEEGARLTPSVVAIDDRGEVLVGQIARRQAITNPENTVFSAKRLIGRKFSDPATQDEIKRVPYKVAAASNGDCAIELRGKKYSPPEISARVLMKLKRAAEEYLGETVTEAVITVPAYFNDSQRQATKDAGRIAGLDVKRIINEPTAAALAYGLDKTKEHVIAVFDLGGGTFDISILEVGDKVVEVISTNGDTHLGGDDIDNRVMDWLIAEFKKDSGIDVSKDKMVLQRLKEAAEKAKIELSSVQETEVNLPYLTADATGPKHLLKRISRTQFERMIEDIVNRTVEPLKKALSDAGKKVGDIHEVVLVGGSTRIPMVQAKVKEFFGKEPNRSVNPDEVVALGAAVQGGVLAGDVKDILLLDVTPLSLAIETLGGVATVQIPRNTTIPTRKGETFSTAADNQTTVEVHVTQGERPMAKDNKTLGRFQLTGIPPAPRGMPQIEVTFDIDANGILNVTAKDKATGVERNITITASGGLSEAEIKRAVEEAAAHEEEDKQRKDAIEARNQLDNLLYGTKKLVQENGAKLSDADKLMAEEEFKRAEQVLESNRDASSPDELRAAFESLQTVAHKLAESMYKQAGGAEGEPTETSPGEGAPPKDDVIDAEFEDKP
ncbi:MAG: molecular chaperone DnaK [Kofleriaceae bacterium]|nr:MAG: molecular chaperone DnaK [Kofleriaceae bacterium]MBZ0233691.1 molecular chaperone DnaK [Kofleriaceae bacterium]